jgi:hypothetical protein
MVVALSNVVAKGLGRDDVHITGPPSSREPPTDVEATLGRKSGVLDIALVSRRRGTISHNTVCGLLDECLQDVSSAILALSYLVVCYKASNVSCFHVRPSN